MSSDVDGRCDPERTEAERLVDEGEPWPSNGLPLDDDGIPPYFPPHPKPRHGQGE